MEKEFASINDIRDGSKIKFIDDTSEVFTVSQWDGRRGWAGDRQDRGWYFRPYQILLKVGKNWLPVESDGIESAG